MKSTHKGLSTHECATKNKLVCAIKDISHAKRKLKLMNAVIMWNLLKVVVVRFKKKRIF